MEKLYDIMFNEKSTIVKSSFNFNYLINYI